MYGRGIGQLDYPGLPLSPDISAEGIAQILNLNATPGDIGPAAQYTPSQLSQISNALAVQLSNAPTASASSGSFSAWWTANSTYVLIAGAAALALMFMSGGRRR